MKYDVTIARYGFVTVEAKNEADAMSIANAMKEDDISWSNDWSAEDASESEDCDDLLK